MTIKSMMAVAAAKATKAAISTLTSRPGGSTPGAVAMHFDADVLSTLAERLRGSVCITGTNGKTSTANLVADAVSIAIREAGTEDDPEMPVVVSNRDGDNMEMGIVTAIACQTAANFTRLQKADRPYGVFECDELYTRKVLPKLRPDALLLLNLFRDQLDRYGEIDRTQKAIIEALELSPDTVLVYNADDPLCAMVAEPFRSAGRCVPFSCSLDRTDSDLLDGDGSASDSRLCPVCGMPLSYSRVAYGQIGNYRCTSCGWEPEAPIPDNRFSVVDMPAGENGEAGEHRIYMGCMGGNPSYVPCPPDGLYMDYNVAAAACLVSTITPRLLTSPTGHDGTVRLVHDAISGAVACRKSVGGRGGSWIVSSDGDEILVRTKLAKNPTGFNRMLKESSDRKPDVTLLLLNDEDPDGHDVSWIWDIDFEGIGIASPIVMTGGERAHDMALRAIYAGYDAFPVDGGIDGAVDWCRKNLGTGATITAIANYTAFCRAVRSLKSDKTVEIDPSDEPLWADRTEIDDDLDEKVIGLFDAMGRGGRPANVAPEFAMAMREAFADGGLEQVQVGTDAVDAHDSNDTVGVAAAGCSDSVAETEDGASGDTVDAESERKDPIAVSRVSESDGDGNRVDIPTGRSLKVTWLYPDAMNLYGDRGNATCIRRRIEAAGIECDSEEIGLGEGIDLSGTDICLIGGGSDRDQKTVMRDASLSGNAESIRLYIDGGGVMLAICGGYQMLGDSYVDASGGKLDGLGIIAGMETFAAGDGKRLIGNTAVRIDALSPDIEWYDAVGFENHGGRTYLPDGNGARPLGKSLTGTGNNGADGMEGVRYRNTIGTYLHGCLLPKNPAIADWMISTAYERKYGNRLQIEWNGDCPLCREERAARKDAMKHVARR